MVGRRQCRHRSALVGRRPENDAQRGRGTARVLSRCHHGVHQSRTLGNHADTWKSARGIRRSRRSGWRRFCCRPRAPGGNVTGSTSFEPSMGGKWLAVLKEAAPHVNRALVILHPETAVHQAFWHSAKEAALRLGIEAIPGAVHNTLEVESAFASFAERTDGGIIVLPHAITEVHR